MSAFGELGVMPELTKALDKLNWTLPTEIQSEAIPLILGGGDILMASETGTGKTGAFCIPIVQVVYEQILASSSSDKNKQQKADNTQDKRCFLSPIDRAHDVVLSQDLLIIQSKSGNWQGCRANYGVARAHNSISTNVYYEIHFADQGLARVGWSLAGASLDLGTDRNGWGYGGTAKKSNNRQFSDYGLPFGEKFDIIGCILNLKTGEMNFTKNGRNMGCAFKLPVGLLQNAAIYPTICVKNAGCEVRFEPSARYNDYKPQNCTWLGQLDPGMLVEGLSTSTSSSKDVPLAIIVEPSRELAKQTYDCLNTFSKDLGIEIVLWIGGSDEGKGSKSKSQIIVSTPGRLSEALNKNLLPLNNIHFFILDEADALLSQGFQSLIKSTHNRLPKMFNSGRRLQTVLCSATLHNLEVKRLAQQIMYFPTWIDLKGEDSVPETVHHVVLRIDPLTNHVYRELQGLFRTDGVHDEDDTEQSLFCSTQPLARPEEISEAIKLMKFYYAVKAIETLQMDQGIIFCRTKLDCDNLDNFMRNMNRQTSSTRYSCARLHSSLSQQERISNLDKFKQNKVKFLICTDVAARGIDVRGIPFLIQVTLPDEHSNYIHRIGRVGRAERMGLAISLVATEPEKVWYHGCNRRQCMDTRLVDRGGCCKYIDELSLLAEIEDHLKCTIQQVESDFKLQVDEFDGKVVYGAKRLEQTSTYEGHVEQLKSLVSSLSELESKAQLNYLKLYG